MVYLVMFYMQELIIKLMILFPLVLHILLVLFLVLPEPLVLKLIEAQMVNRFNMMVGQKIHLQ